jgi:hypothetical protein
MDPSNPFTTVTSDHLAKACSNAAADLSANRPRTREERLELAERVRLVLMAAAQRISPAGSWFSRPDTARQDRDFMASLKADHLQRLRELRYRALLAAAEHTLGAGAHAWIRDSLLDGERLYERALASEQGLDAALGALEDTVSTR